MSKKKLILAAIVILLFAGIVPYYTIFERNSQVRYSQDYQMNTFISQTIFGNSDFDEQQSFQLLENFEGKFSSYVETSEVSRINSDPTSNTEVSRDVFELIVRSTALSEESDGLFDVTIFPLVKLWNVQSESSAVPTKKQLDETLKFVDYTQLKFDDKNNTISLSEDMSIDLGGIAKGEALNKIRELYQDNEVESAIFSIGGNLLLHGNKPDNSDFVVGIKNPRGQMNDYIGTLTISNTIVSTSGDYERFFIKDGIRYHHIIDPFTGMPSASELVSVTVCHTDGAYADFLSTYIFMAGKDYMLSVLEDPSLQFVAIDSQMNIFVSKTLEEKFTHKSTGSKGGAD